MADGPDGCEPCKCIPKNLLLNDFRFRVAKTLCLILESITGGIVVTIAPVNPVVPVVVPFGSITAVTQDSAIFGSGVGFGYLHIANTTDVDIIIGSSATTDWFTIFSGTEKDIQVPVQLSGTLGGIYYKSSTATLPTKGALYIEGGKF